MWSNNLSKQCDELGCKMSNENLVSMHLLAIWHYQRSWIGVSSGGAYKFEFSYSGMG